MNNYEKFTAFSRPSVRAHFDPYLNRLIQAVSTEEWNDALLDLVGIAKLIQQHQLDEKLKQSQQLTGAAGAQYNEQAHPTASWRDG